LSTGRWWRWCHTVSSLSLTKLQGSFHDHQDRTCAPWPLYPFDLWTVGDLLQWRPCPLSDPKTQHVSAQSNNITRDNKQQDNKKWMLVTHVGYSAKDPCWWRQGIRLNILSLASRAGSAEAIALGWGMTRLMVQWSQNSVDPSGRMVSNNKNYCVYCLFFCVVLYVLQSTVVCCSRSTVEVEWNEHKKIILRTVVLLLVIIKWFLWDY
jgi:hypothetical protein